MAPTRRQLLLGGTALAAISGWELTDLPPAAPGCHVLSPEEAGVVAAYADALFPPGNPLGPAARDLDIAAEVDQILHDQEALIRDVFRYALKTLVLGTWASRQAHFSDLPLEIRQQVVHNWQSERVLPRRLLADAIRMELGMAYFNLPAVQSALGWIPSCDAGRA